MATTLGDPGNHARSQHLHLVWEEEGLLGATRMVPRLLRHLEKCEAAIVLGPVRYHDVDSEDTPQQQIRKRLGWDGRRQKNHNLRHVLSIYTAGNFECGDLCDKVYGLLSLVATGDVVLVDYKKSHDDVFIDVVDLVVESESIASFALIEFSTLLLRMLRPICELETDWRRSFTKIT
jgi:hypothetical protein